MAFKMKAGKKGPMNKNFPSVFKQDNDYKKENRKRIEDLAKRGQASVTGQVVSDKNLSKRQKKKFLSKIGTPEEQARFDADMKNKSKRYKRFQKNLPGSTYESTGGFTEFKQGK